MDHSEMAGVLSAFAKTHINSADEDRLIAFVKGSVPWSRFVTLAEQEGVAGLLYHQVKKLGLTRFIPKSAWREIENIYLRTAQATLAVLAEAKSLSALAGKAGLSIAALQGLSVLRLYGDPGLRPLGDMDILVKPEHKDELKTLLRKANYIAPLPQYPDTLRKSLLSIDIHTHILNLERIESRRHVFPEDLSPMWENAGPLFADHRGLLLLDPPDNFIALSAHALKHSYSRLIWLADLDKLCRTWFKEPETWQRLSDRAHFWKQEKTVLYGLLLLEALFFTEVPMWVKSRLGEHRLSSLERLLLDYRARGGISSGLGIALWLCTIQGVRNKWNLLAETLFPKDEVMNQIFSDRPRASRQSHYSRRAWNIIALSARDFSRLLIFAFKKYTR